VPALLGAAIVTPSHQQGPSLNCHCWLRENTGTVPHVVLVSYFTPLAIALVLAVLVIVFVSRAFGGGLEESASMRWRILRQWRAFTALFGLYWAAVLGIYLAHARHVAQHGSRSATLAAAFAVVRSLNGPLLLVCWLYSRGDSVRHVWGKLRRRARDQDDAIVSRGMGGGGVARDFREWIRAFFCFLTPTNAHAGTASSATERGHT
jgi:hypothetical protein